MICNLLDNYIVISHFPLFCRIFVTISDSTIGNPLDGVWVRPAGLNSKHLVLICWANYYILVHSVHSSFDVCHNKGILLMPFICHDLLPWLDARIKNTCSKFFSCFWHLIKETLKEHVKLYLFRLYVGSMHSTDHS